MSATNNIETQIKKYIEREAEKRSKRQSSTGLISLDEALAWHIKIGFEDGAEMMLKAVLWQREETHQMILSLAKNKVIDELYVKTIQKMYDEDLLQMLGGKDE